MPPLGTPFPLGGRTSGSRAVALRNPSRRHPTSLTRRPPNGSPGEPFAFAYKVWDNRQIMPRISIGTKEYQEYDVGETNLYIAGLNNLYLKLKK